jgi:hypothetical protein
MLFMCMRMYILAFTGLLRNCNITYLVVREAVLFATENVKHY